MYYLKSRFYDPKIARFLCADGFTSTGVGDLQKNTYLYCLNNAITLFDPTGTACSCVYDGTAADFHRLEHGLPPLKCRCPVTKISNILNTASTVGKARIEWEKATAKKAYAASYPQGAELTPNRIEIDGGGEKLGKYCDYMGYAGELVGIGENVVDNYKQGKSGGKIAWDILVDVLGAAAGIGISAVVATALGSVGFTALGIFAIGLVIDHAVGDVIEMVEDGAKGWID